MLDDDDLEAAVGAGVVTQAQADALRTFSVERRKSGAAERADEERFRFMRGFNDFFFAIGVVLFGGGVSMYAGIHEGPIMFGLAAATMWGLAELLVRRMRLVLPGIVIVLFFVAFVVSALPLANLLTTQSPFLPPGTPGVSWLNSLFGHGSAPQIALKAMIAGVAAAVFYARFRFPFALLLIAGGAATAFELAASHFLFNDSAVARLAILLLCGVAVFSVAMWFDLSDRLRATRRSDCAFWLHVLAAPLLVHSLVGLVSTGGAYRPDTYASVMIIVIAFLLTIVALIIDRRALLVSALVYVGSAIAFALSNAALDASFIMIATLVILGVLVLALGVGWAPLRRRVVSVLPAKIAGRLPPVVPA